MTDRANTQAVKVDKPDLSELGRKLRRARQSAALSLAEVASSAGISISMLSQLERGIVAPSLQTLYMLADFFGVPLFEFFDDHLGAPREVVVRKGDRAVLHLPGSPVTWELITAGPRRNLQVVEVILEPHDGR